MTYLITGATGTVGSLVVQRLIERGERPRILVRDREKARARYGDRADTFVGDLADASTLKPALTGADAVLLLNSGPHLAARDEACAKAALSAGVEHMVKLSSMDAQQSVGTGVWHARGETAIRAVGIPYTFVQPSGFMSNALYWAKTIHKELLVRSCTAHGKIPFIHPQDIAHVTSEALTTRSYIGSSLPISGPEALSYGEMAVKIGAAIGKTIEFQVISEEQEQRQMEENGDSPEEVAAHLSIYRAIREGRLAKVTDTVQRVLGRRPINFDQWVQENLAVFAERLNTA